MMEQDQLSEDARKLKESLSHLPEAVGKPSFVVVSGLPGTGKSHFCQRLAERVPLAVIESDSLRRVLFPIPGYSPEESTRLFRALHQLIGELLSRGIPVVLDATNLSEHNREYLYRIADRIGARLILVNVAAPPEVVQQRLEARAKGVNPLDKSDADWTVYQRMRSSAQRIGRRHFAVDTSRDITPVIDKIVREIKKSGL